MTIRTGHRVLSHVGVVSIPGTTKPFSVRNRFFRGYAPGDKPHIQTLSSGNPFLDWFREKKDESPMEESVLSYADLIRDATDISIIDELGDAAETTFAQITALLQRQADGEEGPLLTNGLTNTFFVRDAQDELRLLLFRKGHNNNWLMLPSSVEHNISWGAGCRVFFQMF